jgi:hypothetical protein
MSILGFILLIIIIEVVVLLIIISRKKTWTSIEVRLTYIVGVYLLMVIFAAFAGYYTNL